MGGGGRRVRTGRELSLTCRHRSRWALVPSLERREGDWAKRELIQRVFWAGESVLMPVEGGR